MKIHKYIINIYFYLLYFYKYFNKLLAPSCSKQNSREDLLKIKSISDKTLNITSFQIGENISKLEKESNKLKDSMAKYDKNSPTYNNIYQRFNNLQKEINQLRTSEKNVASEQRNRKNREKLTIF